jgi:hypothetical protein
MGQLRALINYVLRNLNGRCLSAYYSAKKFLVAYRSIEGNARIMVTRTAQVQQLKPSTYNGAFALGNSITALQTGYLVLDAVITMLGARLRTRYPGGKGRSLAKVINWRVLGWHQAGLSSMLGVLQWYIARGREKGILVILMLMLMNAS